MIGTNNVTLGAIGGVGSVGWFTWGMMACQTWSSTPNVTIYSGQFNYTMLGTPVFGNSQYWFRACDTTGCGVQRSFITAAITPIGQTTYGQYYQNITEGGFNPANIAWNFVQPYIQVSGATIFYGLIFGSIFVGMWLRTRGTYTASIFGMISTILFASSALLLQLGVPPEFQALGQALLYTSLAGIALTFIIR
jgi:hypothetical protein